MKLLENKRILSLFSYMSKDDIVDILGEINSRKIKRTYQPYERGRKEDNYSINWI